MKKSDITVVLRRGEEAFKLCKLIFALSFVSPGGGLSRTRNLNKDKVSLDRPALWESRILGVLKSDVIVQLVGIRNCPSSQ